MEKGKCNGGTKGLGTWLPYDRAGQGSQGMATLDLKANTSKFEA